MQTQILSSGRRLFGDSSSRFGAILAVTGLLFLSACGGGSASVTENNLADPPRKDGTAPTLTSVSIRESTKSAKPSGTVKVGKAARIDITASEALMKPKVTINDVEAEVIGKVNGWFAIRGMTEEDELGEVYFTIVYQDISGELGIPVSTTTDGSALLYCDDDVVPCPEPVSLPGDWKLDPQLDNPDVAGAGVGPASGDIQWWNTGQTAGGIIPEIRDCLFDDVFRFGASGSFQNVQGDETWLEPWQGVVGESCGAPVAPHDGSNPATWEYDEVAGTITISGAGAHLGLAKAVNGAELPAVAVPDSIEYTVLALEADSMTVTLDVGNGAWWTFTLVRQPKSPLAGKWRLDPQVDNAEVAGAGVGPASGDISWWNTGQTAGGIIPDLRDCWFDDVFAFGEDGSFQNVQGDESWVEAWQGGADSCAAPVAPHDGSNNAIYQYDEDASTLKLTGLGAHLGLAKAVNGAELTAPSEAPESVTYDVLTLDGDTMTVTVDVGNGAWWTFTLVRVSNSPLVGKWKLDPQVDNATVAGAGVGPASGDISWWNTGQTGGGIVPDIRDCWFDDVFHFGDDGSFQNYHGTETWLETWQGVAGESCGAPVAPHDGTTAGSWTYDAAGGTLEIDGLGSYLGLAKAVNGAELPNAAVPDSVVYQVLAQDGDSLTVTIDVGNGAWWTFTLIRVNDSAALEGKWRLDPQLDNAAVAGAGVGPASGDISWWNTGQTGGGSIPDARACWFDDVFTFGADGSFMNVQGDDTWLEQWQGVAADGCGAPVAPHDGSARAIFEFDDTAAQLTIHGQGAHLGLAKAVNGGELTGPALAPDSVTYDVLALDGDTMTVTVDVGTGWWTFTLVRVSNLPIVGNWKLDPQVDNATVAGAGVGPASGDISWWNTGQTGGGIVPEIRACLFDDVFHFGGGGAFQNFQDGETWLEPWQGVAAESCGAPVAPHDGSSAGSFDFDADAATLRLRGLGSHLGLAKAVNGAELPAAAAPELIDYTVLSFDEGTMTVTLDVGNGAWWTFTLLKE